MFENYSFIISTNRKQNHTYVSVPFESELVISTSNPLGKARNDGIRCSRKEWVVICDDDITFDSVFLNFIDKLKSRDRIVGLQAYYPSPLVIGRFMLFHRSLYEDVGDFEERSHGDETEFCYRAVKKGYSVIQVPRESITHHPHQKVKPKSEFPNLLWLIRKHPDFIFYILRLVCTKMRKSSYDKEYKL